MNKIDVLDIRLDNKKVGRLALTSANLCAFEYDTEYLKTGISLSPFFLPLSSEVFVAKRDPFNGNFGVFYDSLPDGWGNLLLDRYLAEKGINPHQLSVLQRLSLIGTSGRGALEYFPNSDIIENNSFVELDKLYLEVEKILNLDYSGNSLDLLYKYGGSSGGARPKVFISINGEEWLIKFRSSIDPVNAGEIEYNYSILAKNCGIEMPETKLFEGKYFGVKRFDRKKDMKYHVISAAGLLNADYRLPSLDYISLLIACFKLTKNIEEVYKLFRLMVFNILIGNKDDHAKNFSFILKNNEWFLSPAYDLLPSNGFNGNHTTTINGKGNPTTKDIFSVAENLKLDKHRIENIFDAIKDALIPVTN